MAEWVRIGRRVVVTYLVLGVLVVDLHTLALSPLQGASWRERATLAVEEILTWPRLLPVAAAEMDIPLSVPGLP